MPKSLKVLLPAILLAGYLILIYRPLGPLPPPANFFDPLRGFLKPAAGFSHASSLELTIPALKGRVRILLDRRGVPHVFAEHAEDLPLAVGYLHARDRLFQMEMIVRSVQGRLAEVLGPVALPSDRFFLGNGLRDAAERSITTADRSHPAIQALEKYTAGINYFIERMAPSGYPLEYKLLDFAPARWQLQNSAYLLKYMARELSWHSSDLAYDRLSRAFPPEVLQELYPIDLPCPAPIYPGRLQDVSNPATGFNSHFRFDLDLATFAETYDDRCAADFGETSASGSTETSASSVEPLAEVSVEPLSRADAPEIGSNNWAVAGAKSASGHAMLANDTHLGHQLPNYWYEVDLHAPGFEAYGFTLPGSPEVIIGFNRDIAWGVTNCGWDVLDYYRIELDSSRQFANIEGKPERLDIRTEKIPIKEQAPEEIQIRWSRIGPVVNRDGVDYAIRWTGHLSGGEWRVFHALNRARNFSGFCSALKNYGVPAQNFVYADRSGNVGMYSAGLMPVKPRAIYQNSGDAGDPSHAWVGSPPANQILIESSSQSFVPFEKLPHVYNPPEGFVGSANQKPTPDHYPAYYDWNFPSPYRGMRIREVLSADRKFTLGDMQALQLDVTSIVARDMVPVILQAFGGNETNNATLSAALDSLRNWDFTFHTNQVAPAIYHAFWNVFKEAIWEKHFSSYMYPPRQILLALVKEQPGSKWFDDPQTAPVEKLHDRVRQIFVESTKNLQTEFGQDLNAWNYGRYHTVSAQHLLHLPDWGLDAMPRDGEDHTLNVAGGRQVAHGPSMRLVVEMGDPIRAYSVNFGGQSGHPGAPHYQDQIDEWLEGIYFPVHFAQNPDDLPKAEIEETITFKPQGK